MPGNHMRGPLMRGNLQVFNIDFWLLKCAPVHFGTRWSVDYVYIEIFDDIVPALYMSIVDLLILELKGAESLMF